MLRRRAAAISSVLGFPDVELSITLTGDAEIAEIAARFGGPARPTDVLSFSMLEGEGTEFRGDALGDVIISIETAERQARRRRVALDSELRDLVVHGILHLVGMDHQRDHDAGNMHRMEDHLRWTLARLR
jgi:probable rRNA maturation factor